MGQAGQGDRQRDPGLLRRGDQLIALGDGGGEQLLGEDVLPRRDHLPEQIAVSGGRGGDGHAVEILPGQQRLEVQGVLDAELGGEPPAALLVVVPDGDELGVRMIQRHGRTLGARASR